MMMLKEKTRKIELSRIICLLLGVLAVLFTIPLTAAEKAKIRLPDGLYMYDSSTARTEDGLEMVGFEKYFIVHNNVIYSSQEATRRFGASKLKRIFTKNKKFKVLFGGEQIGEIHNVEIDSDRVANHDKSFIKNITEGPAYRLKDSMGILGSAVRSIAVPEEYKEARKVSFGPISQEDVDRISKLAQKQLLPLVLKRRELARYRSGTKTKPYSERLKCLDRISDSNDEMYIGVYGYVLETANDSYGVSAVFSAKNNHVHVIATDHDDAISYGSIMTVCGMLDVDGCGREELIIEKEFPDEDQSITNLEIYKQEINGSWTLLKKITTRRVL